MYEGQPLTLESILPDGMAVQDVYVLLAGLAAFMCVMAIGNAITEKSRHAPKLKSLQERRAQLRGELVSKRRKRHKNSENSVNLMRQVVNKFELLKSSQVGQVQQLLIEAGFRSKDAIIIFMFFTFVMPIVGGLVGLALMGMDFWGEGTMGKLKLVAPIAGTYIGLKLPSIYCSRARKKRYLSIQKALADTLDLMTICAEAGLSLAQSIDRVSRELQLPYPEMSEELELTAVEMGFLPDRNKALNNLYDRVKLQEIKGIVSVLIQTEKYGTPIAQALRVLSKEFRTQRMLRAENKAARLPALMTLPMIALILPVLFIVIIAPAAVRLMDVE